MDRIIRHKNSTKTVVREAASYVSHLSDDEQGTLRDQIACQVTSMQM